EIREAAGRIEDELAPARPRERRHGVEPREKPRGLLAQRSGFRQLAQEGAGAHRGGGQRRERGDREREPAAHGWNEGREQADGGGGGDRDRSRRVGRPAADQEKREHGRRRGRSRQMAAEAAGPGREAGRDQPGGKEADRRRRRPPDGPAERGRGA